MLWTATALIACVAAWAWHEGGDYPPIELERQLARSVESPKPRSTTDLLEATEAVIRTNPFRANRRPSSLPFGEEPPLEYDLHTPEISAKPELALVGLTGGPPWEALVAGLPGQEGAVLFREGDVIAGFLVARITRDSAEVQGLDTTWVLRLKNSWQ
jgi:hypothetical protein